MRTRRACVPREHGRAEYWVLATTGSVIALAFFWGLVLHHEPPRGRSRTTAATAVSATRPTTTTLPATLPPPRRYKTAGQVNIRQGAATNTTVLGQLAKDATVVVECRTTGESVTSPLGTSDQWLRILTPAGSGYVSAVYVEVGRDLERVKRLGICPTK